MQRNESAIDFTQLLPQEVILHLLDFLKPRDLLSASMVCRQLHILTGDYSLGKKIGLTKNDLEQSPYPVQQLYKCHSLFGSGNIVTRMTARKTTSGHVNHQLHTHQLKEGDFAVTVVVGAKLTKTSRELLYNQDLLDFIPPFQSQANQPRIQFTRAYDEHFSAAGVNPIMLEKCLTNLRRVNGLVIFSNDDSEVAHFCRLLSETCATHQVTMPPLFIATFNPDVIKGKNNIDANVTACILLDKETLPQFKSELHTYLMQLNKSEAGTKVELSPQTGPRYC